MGQREATLVEGSLAPPSEGAVGPTGSNLAFNWARSRDIVVTVIGSASLLYFLGLALAYFTKITLIFVLSAVVALMLEPLVARLQRRGIARAWATAGIYTSFIVALSAALFWIGGVLVTQLSQLNQQIPVYTQELQQEGIPVLQDWLGRHGIQADLGNLQRDAGAALQSSGTELISRAPAS